MGGGLFNLECGDKSPPQRLHPHVAPRAPVCYISGVMNPIFSFQPQLMTRLPETHRLLVAGGLSVHDAVARVTLHGSRGLAGAPRPDSDIDLGLVVDDGFLRSAADASALLDAVLAATRDSWRGSAELDLAAVFDRSGCGLGCLKCENFDFAPAPRLSDA